MFIKINKQWLEHYTRKLLHQVAVPDNVIDDELENFIWETIGHELDEGDYCWYGDFDE